MRRWHPALAAAAVIAFVACNESPTEPGDELPPELANVLGLLGTGPTTLGGPGNFEIHDERDCPAGGTRRLDLVVQVANETEPNTFRSESTGKHTLANCSASGPGGEIRTTDGVINSESETLFRLPEGGGMVTLLHQTSHQYGTITLSGTGIETRTCDIDLTHTLDMSRRKAKVVGTHCGEPVDAEYDIPDQVR